MNYISKLRTNYMLILVIILSSIILSSCSNKSNNEPEPGESLGIASIPNLRDMGGYKTADGSTITRGLVYRSNQLFNISSDDMISFAKLGIKNDFDLRTKSERDEKPDELPDGVKNVWLDVLADDPNSGPAVLIKLLKDPQKANFELGDGKVEEMFKEAYRQFINLRSAQIAFKKLFEEFGKEEELPALFHCTTGKDRTGWAAAAFLTILGVPKATVIEDYLRSNDYILPMYETIIDHFEAEGVNRAIPVAMLGVKEEYLEAAFEEVNKKYGSMEKYISVGLGITLEQQTAFKNLYLKN